jgi:hypothetical protein
VGDQSVGVRFGSGQSGVQASDRLFEFGEVVVDGALQDGVGGVEVAV